MENILSLKDVENTFLVTMDTIKEWEICVHTGNYIVMKLRECGDRIYYSETLGHENTTNKMVCNYFFLSTVAENKNTLCVKKPKEKIEPKL